MLSSPGRPPIIRMKGLARKCRISFHLHALLDAYRVARLPRAGGYLLRHLDITLTRQYRHYQAWCLIDNAILAARA